MRSVKLAGNLLGLDKEINDLVQIKAGETFSAAKTNDSAKAITDYLGELGYAFANVNPNPQLDRDKHEADLTFYVDPSRRVYVRRIQIGGNTRTRDEVVRRENAPAGSRLVRRRRHQDLARPRRPPGLLQRCQRQDRSGRPGSPDQVDVNVDVKEKPTGMINLRRGLRLVGKGHSVGRHQRRQRLRQRHQPDAATEHQQDRTARRSLSHTDPYWTKDGISRTTSAYYRVTEPWNNNDGDSRVKAMGLGMNLRYARSPRYDRIFLGGNFERNQIDLYNN